MDDPGAPPDLDTRLLRALVAVVDTGTFTEAARVLGLTQASVSRAVQRLEELLGARLLNRTSRYVEPTTAGERVLPHARRVLDGVAGLRAATTQEVLRLGYAWAALGAHTVPLARSWHRWSTAELQLVQTNSPSAGLLEGRCDVAVLRRALDDPRVVARQVATEARWVAVASDDPLARRPELRLEDLVGTTVAVDVGTGTTDEGLWPAEGPAAFRRTDSVDGWLTTIASGRAVGVSAAATAAVHPRPGVTFRPLVDAPPVPVLLAWHRDDPPPALPALLAAVRAAYTGDLGGPLPDAGPEAGEP